MTVKAKDKSTKKIETPIKETSQEAPVKVEESSANPQQINVLSQTDSFVSDLVKEQPKDVLTVEVRDNGHVNILELPEECAALHKSKYRFKWLAKNKTLEARLRAGIWTLCTRENAPFVKPTRFKAHGAVEQAGMLLAFAREEVGARREAQPSEKSASLVKHYTQDLPKQEAQGFYKPADTGEKDDTGDGFEMEY